MNVKIESGPLSDWVNTCLNKIQKIMEQIAKEASSCNDHSITFQDVNYNKDSKTLKIEKIKVHNQKR